MNKNTEQTTEPSEADMKKTLDILYRKEGSIEAQKKAMDDLLKYLNRNQKK